MASGRGLHNLVDETAQARPDAMAIEGADGRMTYGDLQTYDISGPTPS
jgi:hypothetical protein